MVQIAEARPPYVTFEFRAEEDRAASIEAGHYVSKDVAYVLITPMGSKDRIERVAEEWLDKLRQDADEGRFPREWFQAFKGAFADWKSGRESPVEGTAFELWPPASPAQVRMLLDLRIRTVEDLAHANEEALRRIGMGGRALKQKAVDWLSAAVSGGKLAEEIGSLRQENETLRARNDQLEGQLRDLGAKVDALAALQSGAKKL